MNEPGIGGAEFGARMTMCECGHEADLAAKDAEIERLKEFGGASADKDA